MIPWWKTKFGTAEIDAVSSAILEGNISQGLITQRFEKQLGDMLGVQHVVATSSGSAALAMSLMAVDVGRGDEVIVPNRGWIATPHAVRLLGATPIFAEVEKGRPIIRAHGLESLITKRTKAIIPVHLNGRSAKMEPILRIARRHGLRVVEDAAQACFSRNLQGPLGTQGDVGCFSLSIAKIVSTGQGGFAVTLDEELAERLRAIRTQGVENIKEPGTWGIPGFNFRITDIQSAIGLVQLRKLKKRIRKLRRIYDMYLEGLAGCTGIDIIPVSCHTGEIPIYNEVICRDREGLVSALRDSKVETRKFLPNLSAADYFNSTDLAFTNSEKFQNYGVTLPSGPGQQLSDIEMVIQVIRSRVGQ